MVHTKRIATGYGKKPKYITTLRAGAHPKKNSVSLMYIIRDMLGYASTAREARKILNDGLVLVDKKARRDPNYGVGLMDVLEIPKLKKSFILLPKKNKLVLKEIKTKDAGVKLCKIKSKVIVSGTMTQLNLHDGSNIIVEKKDKKEYNTKDTVVLELPGRKIKELLKFKKGNTALVVDGIHSGAIGSVEEIVPGSMKHKSLTRIDGLQTLTDYIFMVGKTKPYLDL
ncbi:MAG: 30S ribosomal protein S4e [Candidatus Altiarchaeales archaeon ex4484_96]|nr:MAG: 30S ribosomal protein S4e [Candidatus Altiarchaeales archaeon ex4484_96]